MANKNIQKPPFAEVEAVTAIIFDILLQFLSSNSSHAAVISLVGLAVDIQDDPETDPRMGLFWGTLYWVVKQIPPDDHRQQKLVKLLESIQSQDNASKSWTNLPGWRRIIADYELLAPLAPPLSEREGILQGPSNVLPVPWSEPLSGGEWTNISGFVARLHNTFPHIPYFDVRGMFALLEGLERDHTAQVLDDLVPPASVWILYAGRRLKCNSIPYPQYTFDSGTKRLPWSIGELYSGPRGFSDERWDFWKDRFATLKEKSTLRAETREYAARAWQEMVLIEILIVVDREERS